MGELGERRKGRRVRLPERPGGRIRATLSARLLDLSITGARIEHHNMLRPGFTCTIELPATMGALILPARVVRSTVAPRWAHRRAALSTDGVALANHG
jgi:hypothetical protein